MIKTPKFWHSKNFISIFLWPFSLLYWLGSCIKSYFTGQQKKFNTKIICVGNAIAGGSGKTPSAIMVGELLIKNGYQVAYVCKNYLSTLETPTQVSSGYLPPEVIEESILLSRIADTFVAQNITDAISLADEGNYDYIITDDGLQNKKFSKDISILVIDGKIGVGNNMMLPAGPLREPLNNAVSRSDIIFIIGEDINKISEKIVNKKIVKVSPRFKLSSKNKSEYHTAFTGIAYPEKFFKSLEKNNISIKYKFEFPDHHIYSEEDIYMLLEKAKSTNTTLITTEKDFVKIPKKYHSDISYLKINLIPDDELSLLNILNKT